MGELGVFGALGEFGPLLDRDRVYGDMLYPFMGEWGDFWKCMGLWFWEWGVESNSGEGCSVRGR